MLLSMQPLLNRCEVRISKFARTFIPVNVPEPPPSVEVKMPRLLNKNSRLQIHLPFLQDDAILATLLFWSLGAERHGQDVCDNL